MSNLDLSIIIVSFNTKDLLRDCINSIYLTARNLSYEVIIIDNASSDHSSEMVEAEFKEVLLIKNVHNWGFGKANNQGINIAKGRYLLLLNSDTLLKEGSVENLVKFLDAHPKAAAVGPRVLNSDGTLQSKGFNFPSVSLALITLLRIPLFFSESKLFKLLPKYYWDQDDIRKVDWISGCCMLLRRESVETVGGLSGDFFMYYEDQEWCYRAVKEKCEIWYFPAAQIIHHNMSSPLVNRSEIGRRSTKIFYKMTIGLSKGAAISFIYILSNIVKLTRLLFIPKGMHEYKDTKYRLKNEFNFLKSLIK